MKWNVLLFAALALVQPSQAANTPPSITILQPPAGASCLPPTESIVVVVQDDRPVTIEQVLYLLNGSSLSAGWAICERTDEGRTLRIEHAWALSANEDYVYEMHVTDTDGATNSARIYFDTFDPSSVFIEAEDYNFGGGRFIDSPNLTPEGVPDQYAYSGSVGRGGAGFSRHVLRARFSEHVPASDPVGLERSNDFARQWFLLAGRAEAGIHDYSVAGVRAGEWLEYTRTFGAQSFKVRLRQWVAGLPLSVTGLEQAVTNDLVRSLVPLGVFLNTPNGGWYRTVPLTDGVGRNEVVFRADGVATVRLKQLTDDPEGESLAHNFLVFIPVENVGILRPIDHRGASVAGRDGVGGGSRDTCGDRESRPGRECGHDTAQAEWRSGWCFDPAGGRHGHGEVSGDGVGARIDQRG